MPLPGEKRQWRQKRRPGKKQNQQKRRSLLKKSRTENLHFHIPYNKIDEYETDLNAYKLNLEIYFDALTLDSTDPKSVSDRISRLSYTPLLTIHGPFMDLSPGAVDPLIQDITINRYNQSLEIANALGAKRVVFHSGYEKWKYDLKIDVWLQNSLSTWSSIISKALKYGIKLSIENIFEDTPDNIKLLMEEMASENFGVCFDTGHFNIFSSVSLETWLDALQPYINELHIHDNDRTSDQHAAPGEGVFDFETLFKRIHPDNDNIVLTVEAHSKEEVLKALKYFMIVT